MPDKPTFADIPQALRNNPELSKELEQFVNMWPNIDAYHPPANVCESITQIVNLALDAAAYKVRTK